MGWYSKDCHGLDSDKNVMKLSKYLVLDVFLCVEFEYVVYIEVSLLIEADARIWDPLNRVVRRIVQNCFVLFF